MAAVVLLTGVAVSIARCGREKEIILERAQELKQETKEAKEEKQ